MERFLKICLIICLSFVFAIPAEAYEYGDPYQSGYYRYRVSGSKKLNVRQSPDTNAPLVTQLSDGDVIYPISSEFNDGYEWYWVPDLGYVPNLGSSSRVRLVEEYNPYFSPEPDDYYSSSSSSAGQTWGKIVLIVLAIVCLVIGFMGLKNYYKENYEENEWFLGKPNEEGMRKRFFYNWEPYQLVLLITLVLASSIVAAIAAMLIIGGLVFGVLWIVKILLYLVMWALIIGGLGGGALALYGGDDSEDKGFGCLGVILGGAALYFKSSIETFADWCGYAGGAFLEEFNIWEFATGYIQQYWLVALIIVLIPIALFLVGALLWMMFAGVLILFEKIVTSRYNVKHPCPQCHHPSEPARYMSFGYNLLPEGVQLRPGVYGLFHITHPITGEEMPTMITNGRDSLSRLCGHCGATINAREGVEKHLVMVGGPESGKSTLTYRFIAELMRRDPDKVSFTDSEHSIVNSGSVEDKIKAIANSGQITVNEMPDKTIEEQTRSMQLIIKRSHSMLDYRLFINDLAGERFDALIRAEFDQGNVDFLRGANSLVILIDPYTMNIQPNNDFVAEWIKENVKLPEEALMDPISLRNALEAGIDNAGINRKKLNINFVLVKADAGYIPSNVNLSSEDAISRFMETDLGLNPLVQWGNQYSSVHFFAVAAMAKGENSRIANFTDAILRQLDIQL